MCFHGLTSTLLISSVRVRFEYSIPVSSSSYLHVDYSDFSACPLQYEKRGPYEKRTQQKTALKETKARKGREEYGEDLSAVYTYVGG